jgi:hypothetical protein
MIMLVKFMSRGKGGGSGPIDYLLGKDRNREQATVIRGNPEQTRELIDSLDFKTKYTSGVLSFEEKDIPEHQKQELMDELERHLMSGLDRDQYDCLWVEHRDKDRLELNFVIPNVELQSNKRLQPYYDRIDRARNDNFQSWINAKYDFSDPNDPSIKRDFNYASNLPEQHKDVGEAITRGINSMIQVGAISNRDDIIESLESNGYPVVRKTKKSISISVPGHTKNVRLNGAMYDQDFRPSESFRNDIERQSKAYREQRKRRAEQTKQEYEKQIASKSEYNRSRYPRASKEVVISVRDAPKRVQQSIEKRTEQSNTANNNRLDYRNIGNGHSRSTGLEISNNPFNNRIKDYERNTKATRIHNQETGTAITETKQRIRGTSEAISETIKRLTESVERYARAVIGLSELRRKQRYEDRPSIRFRR